MGVLVLVAVTVIAWLIYYWRSRDFWERINKIPGPPMLPIIGNAHQMGRNAADLYKKMVHYGKVFRNGTFKMVAGPTVTVMLTSPECIEAILSSASLIDKHYVYKMAIPYNGLGLITSTGKRWKTHRKMITPCFHFSILQDYFPSFNRTANGLAQKLLQIKEGQEFDLYPLVSKSILTGLCETAMGIKDIDEKELDDYAEVADELGKMIQERFFSTLSQFDWFFNLTAAGRKHNEYIKRADNFQKRVLEMRREALKDEIRATFAPEEIIASKEDDIVTRKRLAFLDLLLLTKTADGKPLSEETLLSETKTFLFAGHDTSTVAVSSILYLLSHHPEIQTAVYEEQMSVFGGHERDVTHDDLQAMPYLDRVVKESLRHYNVVPMIGRTLNKEVTLPDGYTLPTGTQIFMLLMCLHMNEKSFPNPTKFDPDRFLPENARKLHPYAFVPFSAGPRNCVGQKYTLLTIKTVVSKLIRQFEFLPHAPGREPVLEVALALHSENGFHLRVRKRSNQ